MRILVLLLGIYANVTERDADSEESLLTEKPSISPTPETPESEEVAITSNIPQVPQNRDYPDYEEEKRQDQKIDELEDYSDEPDEFKNVISGETGDFSSVQYSAAIVLAFTLASVVIFYAWRWRWQR